MISVDGTTLFDYKIVGYRLLVYVDAGISLSAESAE